jgi:ferredoxin
VRWSCRTGVCHRCESGVVAGAVAYRPDPLEPPAEGNVLICCSQPRSDVVIDLNEPLHAIRCNQLLHHTELT